MKTPSLNEHLIQAKTDAHLGQLVEDFARSGMSISQIVRHAPLQGHDGAVDSVNVHGEEQKTLDLMANDILVALLVEQAGGHATTADVRLLDLQPSELHQRVPVVLGSCEEVDYVGALHSHAVSYGTA